MLRAIKKVTEMREHKGVHALSILHHCAAERCIGSLPVCSAPTPHALTAHQHTHSGRCAQTVPNTAQPPPQSQPGKDTSMSLVLHASGLTTILQESTSGEIQESSAWCVYETTSALNSHQNGRVYAPVGLMMG